MRYINPRFTYLLYLYCKFQCILSWLYFTTSCERGGIGPTGSGRVSKLMWL